MVRLTHYGGATLTVSQSKPFSSLDYYYLSFYFISYHLADKVPYPLLFQPLCVLHTCMKP